MHPWRRWLPAAWSVGLGVLLLGPALGPGLVLTYDMVWVPDLVLRPSSLGVGSGLPRAVPSDAVVAVLDEVVPGSLLQKVVLLGALVGGGLGVLRLVPDVLAARLLAVSAYQWNPFVVERLLIGHWPVLVGYAVLPWVLGAARGWRAGGRFPRRLLWLVPLGSLSVSSGLATALVLLAFVAGWSGAARGRVVRALALAAAANAPWLVAGALHAGDATTDPLGAAVFALRGAGDVPAPLAALGLGGSWNAEVVLPSREGPLGWAWLALVLVLVALGWRRWWRATASADRAAYLTCWGVGTGLAALTWAAPGAVAWLAAHVPGGGVVRDGARLLVLAAPLLVVLMAHGVAAIDAVLRRVAPTALPRVVLGGTIALLPVTVLPDAALGAGGRLAATDLPPSYAAARAAVAAELEAGHQGDLVSVPFTSYRQPGWNQDRKVLDPVARALQPDPVVNDELVVSGRVVAGEDPRARDVEAALAGPDASARADALAALGVGFVAVDPTAGEPPAVAGRVLATGEELVVVAVDDAVEREVPAGWWAAMTGAWLLFVAPLLGLLVGTVRRRVGRRPGTAAGAL